MQRKPTPLKKPVPPKKPASQTPPGPSRERVFVPKNAPAWVRFRTVRAAAKDPSSTRKHVRQPRPAKPKRSLKELETAFFRFERMNTIFVRSGRKWALRKTIVNLGNVWNRNEKEKLMRFFSRQENGRALDLFEIETRKRLVRVLGLRFGQWVAL